MIDDRITYFTSANQSWMTAVTQRYKLVVSDKDKPWLIDLEKNPNEDINFYTDPAYKKTAEKLQTELLKQAKQYNDPAFSIHKKNFILQ